MTNKIHIHIYLNFKIHVWNIFIALILTIKKYISSWLRYKAEINTKNTISTISQLTEFEVLNLLLYKCIIKII